MKKRVIVLGRQYGSGARRIGKKLAERLGYRYYDRELLATAAEGCGLCREFFDNADERRPSLWSQFFMPGVGAHESCGGSAYSSQGPYLAQSEVIRRIGDEGGCIIVGRTADYVLRDRSDLLSIFLHAPIEHRAQALVERGECDTPSQGMTRAAKRDREREEYYNYYTGRRWGVASNYDLTFNSATLRDDYIVDSIVRIIEESE